MRGEDREFLAEYDRKLGRAPADPLAGVPAATDAAAVDPPLPPAESPGAGVSPDLSAPPPPPPPKKPLLSLPADLPPPPPTAESSKREDWTAKYGGQAGGREMVCVMLASQWIGLIGSLEESIVLSGGTPIASVKGMEQVFVLAVNDLLPVGVEATPAVVAATVSTTTALQAFVRRKEIKEAVARERARKGRAPAPVIPMDAHRPAPVETIERAEPEPSPPPAAPEPAPAMKPAITEDHEWRRIT